MVKKGHVVSVAVLDEYRKKGIGRILVEESVKDVKLKKGDEVIVTCGKDKGRTGTVMQVLKDGRVLVENINMVKSLLNNLINRVIFQY